MISADSSFRHFLIVLCFVTAAVGCSPRGRVVDGPSVCSTLDSLYDHAGFDLPFALRGKATVDAEQHRFRGKVNVNVSESGNVVFEFTSTILFGSRREDFVVALAADTVRILDRERGYYFEGQEAEDFLNEALALDFGVSEALRLSLGGRLPCDGMHGVRVRSGTGGEIKVTGEVARSSFKVVFSADERRLEEYGRSER